MEVWKVIYLWNGSVYVSLLDELVRKKLQETVCNDVIKE